MRLGDVLRGKPFQVAVRAMVLFLVLFSLAGWALVQSLENTLTDELQAQNEVEALLFSDIYENDGRAGLVTALTQMEKLSSASENSTSLLDEDGLTLTGPISSVPDFVGVANRDISTLTAGLLVGKHYLNVRKLGEMTLVVGRSDAPIRRAIRRVTTGLVLFSVVTACGVLGLGVWASRASLARLQEMDRALEKVSEGDLAARLPVHDKNDQFDRVAIRVNQNLDRLSRLVAGMQATASAIAHDLKTPLSHLQIALHEIADEVAKGADPTQKIDTALVEAESLNAIFDTMLRISRIEADRNKARMGSVNLRDVVEQVADFMRPIAEERQQTLTEEAGDLKVVADASMLKQALVNLVSNASAHAGEGAKIHIGASSDPAGPILSVQDTGPGIPAEDRARVLQPFVRLDSARTTPGSGLGLALVRAVADRHDAVLSLEDANPGLQVSLQFPKHNTF